jgi:hypothetical protein
MPELPEDAEYRRQVRRPTHALSAVRRHLHGSGFAAYGGSGRAISLSSLGGPGWITIDYRKRGRILYGAIFSIALASSRIGIQAGQAIGDSGHGRLGLRQPAT